MNAVSPVSRRVALVLATSTGGVGVHVRSLAQGLIGRGWAVDVVGPEATEELFRFTDTGASFSAVEIAAIAPGLPLWRSVRRLRHATADASLIHAHGLRATAVAVLARRRPLVATWHNLVLDQPPWPDERRSALRRASEMARTASTTVGEALAARGATVSLGASQDLVARIARLGGRDARFAPVAAPSVPSAALSRSAARVRSDLGLHAEESLLVTVARLHPQKGLDVLIDAVAGLRLEGRRVRAVIAGDGPLRARLAKHIRDSDAPVTLLGRRDDVPDLLDAADLVVLPSLWEARSLVAQEAMRAGRALIATRVGGLPELVGDGARLVPAGDADSLRQAIAGLLDDAGERSQLAQRAAAQSRRWPSETDTLDQIEGLYLELLHRSGASPRGAAHPC